jgi:ACS family pantothenate transporter-like MFS transporter
MNGTLGKAGWQWLFIIDGMISLPICFTGYLLYPDFPETTQAYYLNAEDRLLGVKRMKDIRRNPRIKLEWNIARRVFSRWHVYALTLLYVIFINKGSGDSVNPFSLWLKARNYSVALMVSSHKTLYNEYSLMSPSFLPEHYTYRCSSCPAYHNHQFCNSERFSPQTCLCNVNLNRNRLIRSSNSNMVLMSPQALGLISSVLLAIWTIPTGLTWFAFFIARASTVYGPLSMTWANEICSDDAEERAMVLGIMNAMGYAMSTWLPILTYPVVDQPQFRKGFIFTSLALLAQFAITSLTAFLHRREVKNNGK